MLGTYSPTAVRIVKGANDWIQPWPIYGFKHDEAHYYIPGDELRSPVYGHKTTQQVVWERGFTAGECHHTA
jgi:hypothetical protein